jgi:hypothetical protein
MYTNRDANACTFNCPLGQFKDPDIMTCVKTCSSTRFPLETMCEKCSLECEECYGPTNKDCKKCKKEYPYQAG